MPTLKPILVIADLGAAANLVKNLLFLDKNYSFLESPVNDRHQYLLNTTYTNNLTFNEWFNFEARTRKWKIDIAHRIDSAEILNIQSDLHNIIFINHTAFWELDELDKIKDLFNIVYVFPKTLIGVVWQVRAYIEKKGYEELHNFTFENNAEQSKQEMIDKFGVKYWAKVNATNMFNIVKERRTKFYCYAKKNNFCLVSLESLVDQNTTQAYNTLSGIAPQMARNEFDDILHRWQSYHWPYSETLNQQWFDI